MVGFGNAPAGLVKEGGESFNELRDVFADEAEEDVEDAELVEERNEADEELL